MKCKKEGHRVKENAYADGNGLRLQGSMTIEAAVVVPIAMVILAAVVFLAFYAHDYATMTAVNDYAIMENASDAGWGIARKESEALLSQKLYAVSDIGVSVDGSVGNATAVADASFSLPVGIINAMFEANIGTLHSQISVSYLDSRKKLLLYKSICDGIPNALESAFHQ